VKTMRRNHRNYFSIFFIISYLILFLSGCATQKLWHSYEDAKKEKINASSDQIYYSCIDENCTQKKLSMPYKLTKTGINLDDEFPPFEKGIVSIDNSECIETLSRGMKILVEDPSLYESSSINSKLINIVNLDGSRKQSIAFDFRAKLKKHPDTYRQFQEKETFRYKVVGRSYFDEAGRVIPKGMTIFYIGKDRCNNRKDSGLTKVDFGRDFGFSPAKDHWNPIINKKDSSSIHILFINKKMEKVYSRSTVERIMLTPFAIVADVVLVPLALLTAPLWMPQVMS